jgi:molecular chaperone GrpE (heat shock protein)
LVKPITQTNLKTYSHGKDQNNYQDKNQDFNQTNKQVLIFHLKYHMIRIRGLIKMAERQMIRIPSLMKLLSTVETTLEQISPQIYKSENERKAFLNGANMTLSSVRKVLQGKDINV